MPYQQRVVLGVEYDGSGFNGWQKQRQPKVRTVQQMLETALTKIARHPVALTCAGRTDTGVHARGQIVHFDAAVKRPLQAWVHGTNTLLPPDITVHWCRYVSSDFHARYSALSRHYRYVILNSNQRPALLRNLATFYRYPLDEVRMHEEISLLLGKHDFTSFRAGACQANSPVRKLFEASVRRQDKWIIIDLRANAFLLHMVRNIVGTLLACGNTTQSNLKQNNKPLPRGWLAELLQQKDRTLAGITAPPNGLYLCHVEYPSAMNIPATSVPELPFS